MIGQMLGHCRVVAKIGEGGMGIVYRAYDEVLHRDVAVKVVNKDLRLDSSASQSLLHEARASSSLAHPNICTVHEVGETDGELYIVMELVEGKSLRAMSTDAGLPPESVLRYGVQIASALARAHDRGIVHRDLKTANIVVTSHGLVKVLDFGLAKQVGGGIFEGTTRSFATTQDASSVSGTLPYMAPEILRGDAADYRSDLWALGVVLYEAASGRLPFGGRTGFEISSAIMREIPNPLGPPVPPAFGPLLNAALPRNRYSVINAQVKFRQLWKPSSRLESFRPVPALIRAHPGLPSCTVCDTLKSGRETFFCCWERPKEHSSFARMLSAAVGRWVVPISTDTVFTLWPSTTAEAATAYGLRRRVIGEPSCDRATISARAGPIRNRPHSISFRYRGFLEEHLADRAR